MKQSLNLNNFNLDNNQNNGFNILDGAYWNSRYENEQTGWDAGSITTPLKEYIDQINDMDIKILIPGCGNAYEAEYLLKKGFRNITLIDISDVLIMKLKSKFESDDINLITSDFFEHTGKYDLIIEQTFFSALDPVFRKKYAEKMKDLLSNYGNLAGVLFYNDATDPDQNSQIEGPPFIGSAEEYESIFSEIFHIKKMEKCYNSITPRMGRELFINLKLKKS